VEAMIVIFMSVRACVGDIGAERQRERVAFWR
jgi:hypothetical protein